MSFDSNKVTKVLASIIILVLFTFINMFIAVTVSGVVLLEMISSGYNKYVALGMALLLAIMIHLYIAYNQTIITFIKMQGNKHNE